MPRSKEFDTEEALTKAMLLFWDKGYVQTSVDEVVNHTGVSLYSLYNTFGDKKELFIKVLDHYQESVITDLLRELNQADASLPQLHKYFQNLVSIAQNQEKKMGCLMCNTAIELSTHDSQIAQKVDHYLKKVTKALRHTLSNAISKQELDPDTDIEGLTDYLMGVVLGLCVYSRFPASLEAMKKYVETALSVLKHKGEK